MLSANLDGRMIHQERRLPWRLMERSTLPPLVPILWLLSINLAGYGVVKGFFTPGVWFGVLCACMFLGAKMYSSSVLGRRS